MICRHCGMRIVKDEGGRWIHFRLPVDLCRLGSFARATPERQCLAVDPAACCYPDCECPA